MKKRFTIVIFNFSIKEAYCKVITEILYADK